VPAGGTGPRAATGGTRDASLRERHGLAFARAPVMMGGEVMPCVD